MKQSKSSKRISHSEKRINHIITEAKANHKGDEVNYALNRSLSFDSLFSITAYIAPFIITAISLLISNCVEWQPWLERVVQAVALVLAVALGLFFNYNKNTYKKAASKLKKDSHVKNTRIKELSAIIRQKEGDVNFLISLLTNLGRHIARGESTMDVLANHLAVEIYHDCLRRYGDDFEVTINIYEKMKNKIAMIGHQQIMPLCHTPALFLCGVSGMDITDERIKDFYCVSCINSRKDINLISEWKKIVDAFKWHDVSKKDISTSKEACRKAGFTYNQYISSRIPIGHNNDHVILLEIITHNDSVIDTSDNLERTARNLFSIYTPLLVMLTTTASDRRTLVGKPN
jgi:hypothetical protein